MSRVDASELDPETVRDRWARRTGVQIARKPSRCQLRVAYVMASGLPERVLTYARIAAQLGVGVATVRTHLYALAARLTERPRVPPKALVYDWANSEAGRSYLSQPHVRRRAGIVEAVEPKAVA